MKERTNQLKVIKTDGSIERYLYTKVVGTINNALVLTGEESILVAEQLADAITYFLYIKQKRRTATSSEIFSMIQVVLASTCYEAAAEALNRHHYERKLKRSRTEVISVDIQDMTDAEFFVGTEEVGVRSQWDKCQIAEDLIDERGMDRQTARMIAAMVEEKVFGMGMTRIPSSLIRQLVLGDTATVERAREQFQTV